MRLRLLPFLLSLGACTFNASVPPQQRITCDERSACPPSYVCRPRFGVCVSANSSDRDAPRLTQASVSPRLARRSTTVVADVHFSEALTEPPLATFVQEGQSRAMTLRSFEADTAVFEYAVAETDMEGTASVVVDAIDSAGNEALQLVVGTVTLDFTGPRVSPPASSRLGLPPAALSTCGPPKPSPFASCSARASVNWCTSRLKRL